MEVTVDAHACQAALVDLAWNNENILITNLVTIGAKNSIISNGELTPAMDNLAVKSHPSVCPTETRVPDTVLS